MPTYYIRADFQGMDALRESIGPSLQVGVKISLVKGGGYSPNLEMPEASGLYVTCLEADLQWVGDREGGGMSYRFLSRGALRHWQPWPTLQPEGEGPEVPFIFPLNHEVIQNLEELRRGGKPRFAITIRLSGHIPFNIPLLTMTSVNEVPPDQMLKVSDLPRFEKPVQISRPFAFHNVPVMQGREQVLSIETSKWAEVLMGLGYGAWRTYEIPLAGLEASLSKADGFLDQANRHYVLGNWQDSLISSRRMVEALDPYLKGWVNPVHTDKRGGPAAQKAQELSDDFEALKKSMLDYQGSVRKFLAAGAHDSEQVGATVERADAELGLGLALTLRRYVGLRMVKGPGHK